MVEVTELDPAFAADERIFHYTTGQGLYGILKSKTLWATHFEFLNDRREFLAARNILVAYVSQRLRPKMATLEADGRIEILDGETLEAASDREAQNVVDQFYDSSFRTVGESYVFSGFCCTPDHDSYRNGGQLHWSIYGRNGGYAIRLNPHKLYGLIGEEEKVIAAAGYITGKVVYSPEELVEEFKKEFRVFADVATKIVLGRLNKRLPYVDIFRGASPFHQITGLSKEPFFRGEEEARIVVWRLVKCGEGERTYPVEVRHRDGVTVPYVELFKNRLFQSTNPIEAIIVGPHAQNTLRLTALKTYLKSIGLGSIDVIESNVPYIG